MSNQDLLLCNRSATVPLPCLQLKVFPDEHTYHDKMKQLLGQGLCTCINR